MSLKGAIQRDITPASSQVGHQDRNLATSTRILDRSIASSVYLVLDSSTYTGLVTDTAMALEDQIASRAKEIHTDGYPMSIGEVLSLYNDGDMDIHPEFQRIFRWDEDQKSRLIESLLLRIPIPPIFVSQRPDGVWDIIDGVQRLSTIFEFIGVYRDEDGYLIEPSTLRATEYLPDLDGYRWERAGPNGKVFTDALRRDIKRAKLEFRIIRKESDENAKYDLFQRLNSGTQLSPQEARNCLLVMLNRDMYGEIVRLSEQVDFAIVVPLSETQEGKAYRQELVLRFFVQADYEGTSFAATRRVRRIYHVLDAHGFPGIWFGRIKN